ncbi:MULTISPECIES: DNA primase [unclassified Ruegeria]|uniref:DNA primase n=1 Tax=unclassified Ruegeria TaxID=2625375 RepID=UPI001489628E|nr:MULTISPECIES: DNA primase [unclassified Ruegeria]NOD36059.1 DNA primase [Ruegeria sp. HKCCD7296]NOD45797.1 DNA primase [Ruegeria sp. HKCCD5849]NOD50903.1 DNA primase [Ruegeria sp. HKCCD5851]NOD67710.1 DNA primase [Ruegeria sp. HKCCD7303]NOE43452.1 DNA primase [Ruegeria sp. HKCCD7319]
MSLPPGFLDELRTRLSLSQVVGRKVMWDQRKSNQGKGDMWAPCPFHHEKTASFHVDDQKGFYYCFGCHAKGDAISFVKETENVSFIEAVEILAREAGMPMPARDPKAQEKLDRRSQLADVMEQAVQFFRLQLKTGAGATARDYLAGRGLDAQALDRWEIGFAPDGWQALWDHLRGKNVAEDLILGAGLAKPSNKGKKPYDTFRNRIMFPIRDARGRCIAFGGRAMDPNDNAKYLNSPETELFDKGRSLYNHGPARQASGKGQPLIVAEGYMDVIALAEAGFGASVAPLGTAITEHQLQLLWRVSNEPIIALDGDTAGLRAAMRAVDLALPLLEAGKSLRFALMPEGKDPDDLLRAEGPGAVQSVLESAIPMVKLLWQRETEGKIFDSPERKAALDKSLREKLKLIRDPSIRSHYGQEIKDLRWQLFRPQRQPQNRQWQPRGKWQPPQSATPGARASFLASSETADIQLREAAILAISILNPQVVVQFEHQLEDMECLNPEYAALRDAILRHAIDDPDHLKDHIVDSLGHQPLENLLALRHVAVIPCVYKPGDVEKAEMTLAEELAKIKALRGLDAEIAEAAEELSDLADEALTYRLAQAAEERNRTSRSQNEDRAVFDIADNGARINRDEKDAFEAIMSGINFERKRR